MTQQLPLQMITYYAGPKLVPAEQLANIRSYREAVRTCYALATRPKLMLAVLADEAGLYPSHVSDYLSERPNKRELPAKHIAAFEISCGNRVISQWLARQSDLTIVRQADLAVLEQLLQQRRVA